MMKYRQEVFTEQFPLAESFARHLVHHRVLKAHLDARHRQSWFWTDTCNAHLLQASMYWCMVFGSYGPNPTHLRHLAAGDEAALQKSFRDRLTAVLGIDETEWRAYWETMQSFRGGYAAHRALGFGQAVPQFDRALEAAFCYDEWVREIIKPDLVQGPRLRRSVSEWEQAVSIDVVAALSGQKPKPTSRAASSLPSAEPRRSGARRGSN